MGVQVLEEYNGGRAVLYCSTTDWAFGPVFASTDHAQSFLTWLYTDPRGLTDSQLESKYSQWQSVTKLCAFCSLPFQPAEATSADQLCETCYDWQQQARDMEVNP